MKAKTENTDDLIEKLSGDLKPVRHVWSPLLMIAPWLIIVVAYLAGVIHFLGVRMDIEDKLADSSYIFELLLITSIGVSAGYTAALLAVPDMRQRSWVLTVPVVLLGVFIMFMFTRFLTEEFQMPHESWHHCFSDALLMCFVPVMTLILLVRTGATTRPNWMAFMSVLSVSALGWGALRISCMDDTIGHTLFFHFIPFVAIAALLSGVARRLFRW